MQQSQPHPETLPTPGIPGRWRRFACMMYEGVLLFAVVFLASYLFDTLTQSRQALMFRHGRQFVIFLAIGVYFIMSWRRGGQTLPMRTWHMRLVRRDGTQAGVPQLAARYILMWPIPLLAAWLVLAASRYTGYSSTDLLIVFAPFTVFLWTWVDREQQFLHDRIAGTRLVNMAKRPDHT